MDNQAVTDDKLPLRWTLGADLWPITVHESSCTFRAWDQTTRCNCRTNALIESTLAEAAQGAAALDVPTLAAVLSEHFGPSYFPGLQDVTIIGESPEKIAEAIADAYQDRLR